MTRGTDVCARWTMLTVCLAMAAPVGAKTLVETPACEGETTVGTPLPVIDLGTRGAAQKGLDFLAKDTVTWQAQHACYGCHVQSVTLSAMSVGRHNQYTVDAAALAEIVRGITTLPGGSRTGDGLRYAHGTYYSASRSLGGAAFARYDAWVATDLRDDLLKTAEQLLAMRSTEGFVVSDYSSAPVAVGVHQDTVLAMQTWKQAYERTADDRWLTAVAGAEQWLLRATETWPASPPGDLQLVNYTLLGLEAAGSGMTEPRVSSLVKLALGRQNEDGGWSLQPGSTSDAYATGQTLYTLRALGMADADPQIARGTRWLVTHQTPDGSWSHRGSQRAEAMWGVLGLVSVDVLSLAVKGVSDGDRVDGVVPVEAIAFDNQGGKVVKVEMFVDDDRVATACGSTLAHSWNTTAFAPGPHVVDLQATNAAGKVARRRLEVFTGPIYLTRLASVWEDGGTRLSLRNTAPDELGGQVRLTIRTTAGAEVYRDQRAGTQGAMGFWWDGTLAAGGKAAGERFVARFEYIAPSGKVLHQSDTSFVHADPAAQAANFANVQGRISFSGDEIAENVVVELVDGSGSVVAATRTTSSGQYLFKNIDTGKYKVRVDKAGREFSEAEVSAAPTPPAAAPPSVDLAEE